MSRVNSAIFALTVPLNKDVRYIIINEINEGHPGLSLKKSTDPVL